MKALVSSKVLSIALVAAAFAAVGSVPASAQSASHDGSLMPHYFDKNGELKWGGWGPAGSEQPQQQAASPQRSIYLYAKPHAHHRHVRS
jgi:hypothetical protein